MSSIGLQIPARRTGALFPPARPGSPVFSFAQERRWMRPSSVKNRLIILAKKDRPPRK